MYIFISGTGRSGSSILSRLLLKHKHICGLDFESRFTVSPDGIFEFLKASRNTQNLYSYNVSLFRLFKLLEALKNNKSKKFFKNWNLSKSFSNYDKQIRLLKKKLLFKKYDGTWHGKYFYNKNKYLYLKPSNEYITKHLSIFLNNIHKLKIFQNKNKYFLDNNTWSLYFAKEIDNMRLNYRFIHMIRDPRYTVMSLMNQNWSPSNIVDASEFYLSTMNDIMLKIRDIKKTKLLTLKYEDLIFNRERELEKIFKYLDISKSNNFTKIKVYNGNEKYNISSKNWKYLTNKLNYYIKYFNYNHR